MQRATWLAVGGIAPLLLLGLVMLGSTLSALADPCMTWGDRWGSPQSGGGTSPGPPGCEGGTHWTTEAPGSALVGALWLPLGSLATLALAAYGLERRSDVAAGIAVGALLGLGAPLTLGATILLAPLPSLAVAYAARQRGLASRPGTIGAGLVAGAAAAYLLATLATGARALAPSAWLVAGYVIGSLVAIALLCLLPGPRPPRAPQATA